MNSKSGIAISVIMAAAIVIIPTLTGVYVANRIFGKLLPKAKDVEQHETPFQQQAPDEPTDGLPKVLFSTGIETHLSKTFDEIKTLRGMCLLNDTGDKPKRSHRIWPAELPTMGTAQAEWTINGQLVTVLWLPPGADSPSAMVQHDSIVRFTNDELMELLKSEGESAWQRNAPLKTENLYGKDPITRKIITGKIPGITFWRMDGASVDIQPKRVTFRNAEVTRLLLEHILTKATSGKNPPRLNNQACRKSNLKPAGAFPPQALTKRRRA